MPISLMGQDSLQSFVRGSSKISAGPPDGPTVPRVWSHHSALLLDFTIHCRPARQVPPNVPFTINPETNQHNTANIANNASYAGTERLRERTVTIPH
jgi:hypothetical protein